MGFKAGLKKAGLKLLEPVMDVEVVTPEEYLGEVLGDFSSRRGRVKGMEPRGVVQTVQAEVPLSAMFGYATDIRSATQGRATFSMQFSRYAEVPSSIVEEILTKDKK
jgi:elongation factor G